MKKLLTVLFFLLAVGLQACSSAPVKDSKGKIKVAGVVNAEWETTGVDPDRTVDITSDDPSLKGKTVCVTFKQDGQPLGEPMELTIPCKNVPLPPGADSVDSAKGECKDEDDDDKKGWLPNPSYIAPNGWDFFGMPLSNDTSEYYDNPQLTYMAQIHTRTQSGAAEIRDMIVNLGLDYSVPNNVEIEYMTYFWLDRTNQVVVFQVVETDDFHEIHFDFNDAPYADLDDAIVTHQNGWNVATFTIPFDDPILNWDVVPGDYRNFYDVTVQVQKGIDIQEVSGNAEWTFEIISKEE